MHGYPAQKGPNGFETYDLRDAPPSSLVTPCLAPGPTSGTVIASSPGDRAPRRARGGTYAAAWPLIRDDLGLSYAEVGVVLAVPGFVGSALDPLIGAAADTARDERCCSSAGSPLRSRPRSRVGLDRLLDAACCPADRQPVNRRFRQPRAGNADGPRAGAPRAEHGLVDLAGSFGYVGGPVILTVALWIGVGWRGALAGLALVALSLTLAARRLPSVFHRDGGSLGQSLGAALRALRRREVLRWLAMLEAADLLLDVLFYFLALYLVDVAGWSVVEAAFAPRSGRPRASSEDALLIPCSALFVGRRTSGRARSAPSFATRSSSSPQGTGQLAVLAALGLLNLRLVRDPQGQALRCLRGRVERRSHSEALRA